MQVLTTEKKPIKSWCAEVEDGALAQAKNLANLPFTFKHVALMPDCHQGYGMPIGGVLATQGVVIPNAVGVDIGCGMRAIKTDLRADDMTPEFAKDLVGRIRKVIPVGFKHRDEPCAEDLMPVMTGGVTNAVAELYQDARKQLGTLGGGNHFLEIQKGSDGFVWIMIHSGSRNLGKQIADLYNKEAKVLNEKYFCSFATETDLAFLPTDDRLGQNYLADMNYCKEFASNNRREMMLAAWWEIVHECVERGDPTPRVMAEIDVPHNYAVLENHYGYNVYVHRKGATRARSGEHGLIPGSQGSASFVVVGKGNDESFCSCSHGAGRRMGRKQAQRELDLEAEKQALDAKGIVHSLRNTSDLDEAPGAYKDIETVMQAQQDLVSISVRLEPVGVVKG